MRKPLDLAAADFAPGTVPRNAMHCFTMATLTALQKKDGGVRGIATGTTFRRLVAKSVAKQFGKDVEAAMDQHTTLLYVHLLCDPSRVKVLYELLESRVAGIQLHQGKTRAWN